MEVYDKIKVTLTMVGATFLNKESITGGYYQDFHDNEVVTCTLVDLFRKFKNFPWSSGEIPFTNLRND